MAIARSRDKLRALQLLSRRGVGLPVTGFAHSPDDIPDLIQMVNGAPLVIKVLEGTQGIGVVLCETEKAAESVIEAFMGLKQDIMVQEYIKEAGGADIRCFVVGDKVIASMKRQAKPGEFRSNLHRGGTASLIKITPEERMTAIRAAKVMGLNVAGVDILRSNHGPLVMEVNSSPGLAGIEETTGKDVAGLIIEYLEKNGGPHLPAPRARAERRALTAGARSPSGFYRIPRQQQPQRQADPRLQAATLAVAQLDYAAVLVGDALDDRQPQAGALATARGRRG
ncbi:Glutathione synthetase [Stutzerimonas stutzeri]